MPKGLVYIPREDLERYYIEQGLSLHDVGKIYGVKYKPIVRHLDYYNLPRRSHLEGCQSESARGKNRLWRTGRKFSEETLQKLRERPKRFGFHISEETKAKLRASQLGNTHMRDAIERGFVHTEEMRRKMSEALSNRVVTTELRARFSLAHKGHRRHSPEQIEKIRLMMLGNTLSVGRIHSEDTRAKRSESVKQAYRDNPFYRKRLSECHIGVNNPQWLGGIGFEPYSPEFNNALKTFIRLRDNYTCQKCGVPQSECIRVLAVHHIDYDKKNNSSINLITLCVSCNVYVNKDRDYWTEYFQDVVNHKQIAGCNTIYPEGG